MNEIEIWAAEDWATAGIADDCTTDQLRQSLKKSDGYIVQLVNEVRRLQKLIYTATEITCEMRDKTQAG